MVKINWDAVKEEESAVLEEGTYKVKVDDIEERTTKNGHDMWRMKLKVIEGDDIGKVVFDNLIFSEKALKRVKLVAAKLGINLQGEQDFLPSSILGKEAYVKVVQEDYEANDGSMKKRNTVPFNGFISLQGYEKKQATEESNPFEDAPF